MVAGGERLGKIRCSREISLTAILAKTWHRSHEKAGLEGGFPQSSFLRSDDKGLTHSRSIEYTSWSIGNGDLIRLPHNLEGRDAYEVNFGIPKRFENDWHRVVIAIQENGNIPTRAIEIYPSDVIGDYPVPLKQAPK